MLRFVLQVVGIGEVSEVRRGYGFGHNLALETNENIGFFSKSEVSEVISAYAHTRAGARAHAQEYKFRV
jgi:hypothetical protein